MTVTSKLQANAERNKETEKRQKREEKAASFGGAVRDSQSETRCQKTSSVAGARGIAMPRARAADDLSAQGRGLCALRRSLSAPARSGSEKGLEQNQFQEQGKEPGTISISLLAALQR